VYLQDALSEQDALQATYEDHVSSNNRDLTRITGICHIFIFYQNFYELFNIHELFVEQMING